MKDLRQDLHYGFRQLAKNPSFALLAVFTLTLGIGVSTSVFSIVRAVLLRPLPYQDSEQLFFIWRDRSGNSSHRHSILTIQDVQELRANTTTFQDLAAVESWRTGLKPLMDLYHPQGTERLRGSFATTNFFDLLGVSALIGRTFAADDAQGEPVAVLSHGFWQRRYGGDPSVVGQEVSLVSGRRERASRTHTIIGVLPPQFHFTYPEETEVWVPMPWHPNVPDRALLYQVIARLKQGATPQEASTDATRRLHRVIQTYDLDAQVRNQIMQRTIARVERMEEHIQHEVRSGVLLLAAVSGLVLLIACVNVAALVLARSVDRRREFAVRAALGATRWRQARSLLVDGFLVAAIGCGGGVLLAYASQPLLERIVPAVVPRADEISVDVQVLGLAVLMAAMSALVCGLAGIHSASRCDLEAALRRSGSSLTADRAVARLRRFVMGFQVGVVVLLLIGAGLLLHSWWRLHQVNPGYDGRDVLTMEMRLIGPKFQVPGSIARFQQQVLQGVRALPGVEQASITTAVPMRGVDFYRSIERSGGPAETAHKRSVDPGYFGLMRIPLLSGRLLDDDDTETSPAVTVISESLSRSLFGQEDPLGQLVEDAEQLEVVGVVGDVSSRGLAEPPPPAYYVPRAQNPSELICLVIRSGAGAANLAARIRKVVQSVDPYQPIEHPATLDQILAGTTAHQRFYTASVASFAGAALILAMVGLLGVVSRTVSEKRREIALRVALGAAPGRVVRLVLHDGMLPVLAGLSAGLVAAMGASRFLEHLLFEVKPLDPWSYALTAALVALASLAACYFPARRASRADAMPLLKAE